MVYVDGDNIALCILNIIMDLGAHDYEDIFQYFPKDKHDLVEKAIGNLMALRNISEITINGVRRLYPYGKYSEYFEIEERRLRKPLVVFRHILQSTDENGEYAYMNGIEYYSAAAFPYAVVFKYKSQIYYILYADSGDYPNFNILMNELDKREGLPENESRIIVTDNGDNLEKLSVRNVINVVAVDSANNLTFLK